MVYTRRAGSAKRVGTSWRCGSVWVESVQPQSRTVEDSRISGELHVAAATDHERTSTPAWSSFQARFNVPPTRTADVSWYQTGWVGSPSLAIVDDAQAEIAGQSR